MTSIQLATMADRAEKIGKLLMEFAADLRATGEIQPELFPEPPKKKFDPRHVDLPFEEGIFKVAWLAFCDARARRKKPVSEIAAHRTLKTLAGYTMDTAIKALETSIGNDWTGVFPEKVQGGQVKSFRRQDEDRFIANMAESAKRVQSNG